MKRPRVLLGVAGLAVVLVGGALVAYESTVYRPGPEPRADIALVGGTVLAGNDLAPIPDGVVLVRDGVIVDVGPSSAVEVPPDVTTIDVAGRTVMPGLIDPHVHLGSPELDAREGPGSTDLPGMFFDALRYAPGHRRAALEHGVTTVRNVGDEHGWITDLRRQIQDGTIEGPRVLVSGPLFTTGEGHPIATFGVDPDADLVRLPTTPDQARRMVRALAMGDDRVDVIKVVQERGGPDRSLEPIPTDVLGAIVDEAHGNGSRSPPTGAGSMTCRSYSTIDPERQRAERQHITDTAAERFPTQGYRGARSGPPPLAVIPTGRSPARCPQGRGTGTAAHRGTRRARG